MSGPWTSPKKPSWLYSSQQTRREEESGRDRSQHLHLLCRVCVGRRRDAEAGDGLGFLPPRTATRRCGAWPETGTGSCWTGRTWCSKHADPIPETTPAGCAGWAGAFGLQLPPKPENRLRPDSTNRSVRHRFMTSETVARNGGRLVPDWSLSRRIDWTILGKYALTPTLPQQARVGASARYTGANRVCSAFGPAMGRASGPWRPAPNGVLVGPLLQEIVHVRTQAIGKGIHTG